MKKSKLDLQGLFSSIYELMYKRNDPDVFRKITLLQP